MSFQFTIPEKSLVALESNKWALALLGTGFELAVVFSAYGKPRSEPPRFPYVDYVLSVYNILSLGSTAASSMFSWGFQQQLFQQGVVSGKKSYLSRPYGQRQYPNFKQDNTCGLRFRSPMDDIVEWYQELALRVSVISAVERGETKRVKYYGETIEEVDKIRHMGLFVLCVVVGFLPAFCIALIEWRVDKLPREFPMSPLELAYFFLHQTEQGTNGNERTCGPPKKLDGSAGGMPQQFFDLRSCGVC